MKFKVYQNALAAELAAVIPAVETKSTLPMSGLIMVETKQGRVVLSATNLDFGIRASAVAEIEEPGKVVTNAARLYEWISKTPGDSLVSFNSPQDAPRMMLSANKSRIALPGVATYNFPPFPKLGDKVITLNGEDLKTLLVDASTTVGDKDDRFAGLLVV